VCVCVCVYVCVWVCVCVCGFVCECVCVCNLETSTTKRPRPDLSCCATQKSNGNFLRIHWQKNNFWLQPERKIYVYINSEKVVHTSYILVHQSLYFIKSCHTQAEVGILV
jgi:hypothetical protein